MDITTSAENIGSVRFIKSFNNQSIGSQYGDYILNFNQTKQDLQSLDKYVKFIKKVEKMVRNHDDYRRYKDYLVNDIGLDRCSVLSNITVDDADIEMHHGPILTLYDCCSIITDYLLNVEGKVNSFQVAEIVLIEHFENNIQVVMLCETVHQAVHQSEVYINPKQAWGDMNKFIDVYREGLTPEIIDGINKNIEIGLKYESTDNDLLSLQHKIKKWTY